MSPGAGRGAHAGSAASSRPSAFTQVTERIGGAICDGTYPPGTVLTVEELEVVTGASRSVVREAARVLASKGLLRARKRVGLEILGEGEWSLFDAQVIRWRLDSPQRQTQLASLHQLRIAIEPEAARLAAENGTPEQAGEIISAAGRLWSAGVDGEHDQFLRDDASLHRLILRASGNPMFAQLSDVIHEALRERTLHELTIRPISLSDVQLHVDLAGQIQRRRGNEAGATMREIIRRTQPS
ncbi:DNA-binding FadR family transcriptional regulator [Mycetocola sp. CAN_C7]|uniref:FadR/GntR family transcriptional regulator n=1 Tax=Mycetocola sp. CAN_C7 TaxID=2787724 RepID=UPI0018CACC92